MGKDEQGSECTKCAKSVFEVVDKCPACGEQTKRFTWHKRIRVERLAVVGTLGLVGGIVGGASLEI